MTNPRDSPGVHVPPPLIYLAGIAAGGGLNDLYPVALLPEAPAAAGVVAKAFIAAGVILTLASLFSFARHRTAFAPTMAASRLLTGGLYRFSRNPIYLGFTLVYLGVTLRANVAWMLACLPLVLLAMSRYVIPREERHLAAVFGEDYRAYCRSVRRWL